MDKLSKVRAEIKRLKEIAEYNLSHSKMDRSAWMQQASVCTNLLSFIDSMQKEPVSVWHDASKETPAQGSNILMIRKKEKDTNYPPIAGCFHGTNSRLDGRNWGYYNGFCYNEIEPPFKWAYVDDLLNLSNFERTVKDWKEELANEKKCMFTKDNYTDEDRKVLCEGCEEECEFNKKEEPVSEDLNTVAKEFANNITEKIGYRLQLRRAVCFGANWKKEQLMAKAVDVEVKVDAGGYPYIPQMELYDYDKDIPLAKEGDKYKVFLIKE